MSLKIALAGNPNVGKSTVFNALTGLRQHTGNWAGKTVDCAEGVFRWNGAEVSVTDLPGTYSLFPVSEEESVAYNGILYGNADAVIVVCDASCLCRNMNLVLQILEITPHAVLCVNLCDEAKRRGIAVDTERLERILGIPVVAASARSGEGLDTLKNRLSDALRVDDCYTVRYPAVIESAINRLEMFVGNALDGRINERYASLRLLERGKSFSDEVYSHTGVDLLSRPEIASGLDAAQQLLADGGVTASALQRIIVRTLFDNAERICDEVVRESEEFDKKQLHADLLLTRRLTGIPIMLCLLCLVFYITITGANSVSAVLAGLLGHLGTFLSRGLFAVNTPVILHDALIFGIYRVLSWVVAVMLPPMAIFFPLFTILEDAGLLPRIAFNLDGAFLKCRSCGKQALTMAMGFGCNAVGVTGCRIIDSPRERLIAMLTNVFVPCNGRFPLLITMISAFFVGVSPFSTILSALILTAFIALGVGMTFFASYLLSVTVLKGKASSPVLELPPFRMPQFGKVLVRSVLDRTVFVLGRAVTVAAPAGLLIWLLANLPVDGASLLSRMTAFLDPLGRFLGLDGVILTGFILGLPANEIVLPIIVMAYTSSGVLAEYESIAALKTLLLSHGWTAVTALCVIVFALMHSPCSTTLMTIKKESGSLGWTILAAAFPTLCGAGLCLLIRLVFA